MANRKLFNSKNIVHLIETLLDAGKADLVMQILNVKELNNLLPRINAIFKLRNLKMQDFAQTKIYSKTELKEEVLKSLGEHLNINVNGAKIIIDENMSAGVKVKTESKLIDASLATMLQNGIEELLK